MRNSLYKFVYNKKRFTNFDENTQNGVTLASKPYLSLKYTDATVVGDFKKIYTKLKTKVIKGAFVSFFPQAFDDHL